jgi:hypothetical protein
MFRRYSGHPYTYKKPTVAILSLFCQTEVVFVSSEVTGTYASVGITLSTFAEKDVDCR